MTLATIFQVVKHRCVSTARVFHKSLTILWQEVSQGYRDHFLSPQLSKPPPPSPSSPPQTNLSTFQSPPPMPVCVLIVHELKAPEGSSLGLLFGSGPLLKGASRNPIFAL